MGNSLFVVYFYMCYFIIPECWINLQIDMVVDLENFRALGKNSKISYEELALFSLH